ncbi:hypothetical protein RMATCC62417_00322 [Rhizopus microsporus]|nr:hypothetical protein RMATCC62417_00322 [Rhizopus microsporus]
MSGGTIEFCCEMIMRQLAFKARHNNYLTRLNLSSNISKIKVQQKLDANVKVSVSKRFVTNSTLKTILLREHDWNEPKLSFQGKMIARSEENDKVMYDVLLDEASGHILKLSEGAIKYVGPLSTSVAQKIVIDANVVEAEDLLEDAVDEDEEEESINLTSSRG